MGKYHRWIRPEVYPLAVPLAAVVGLCAYHLGRSICGNPDVRVNKENRAAGILDNHAEGKKYSQHKFRKFILSRKPEVMPSINKFFSDPSRK